MLDYLKRALTSITERPSEEDDGTHRSGEADDPVHRLLDPQTARREHLIELLEANGGRMWQQELVAELGLSAATVSRTLSDLEAAGEITRYYKGNKKVVALQSQVADVLEEPTA